MKTILKFWNYHYRIIWILSREFVFTTISKILPYSCPAHYDSVW